MKTETEIAEENVGCCGEGHFKKVWEVRCKEHLTSCKRFL